MEYLVVGVVLVTLVAGLNVLLTAGLVRRWRAFAARTQAGHDHQLPSLDVAPGARMADFTAVSITGDVVRTADFTGRETLAAFLSLDCSGCTEALPVFIERSRELRDAGGRVLAFVAGENAEESDTVAKLRAADVVDALVTEPLNAPTCTLFGVRRFPGFVRYGADGVATHAGTGKQALDLPLPV